MAKNGKAATKSEIFRNIAEDTGLTRKQVASVFDSLNNQIKSGIGKRGPGAFTLPGLAKIVCVSKPATKAGIRPNPFKPGEMMEVKAKPARRQVKVRPLRGLKQMVA